MHPRLSINALSLEPANFTDQVDCVARLGVGYITPDVGQLSDLTAAQVARLLSDGGVNTAGLTHRAFGFADPAEVIGACDRLHRSIDFAHEIGASSIVMTTGGRGGLSWAEAAARFADSIAPCAALAKQAGVHLGIEPTSHLYADVSIVHRLSDTVALAHAADIGVAIDLFACWADADIDAAIGDAAPIATLVQVSDYSYGDRALPCRAVPGDGAIPLRTLLPNIAKAGFTGIFDLEIIGPRLGQEGFEQGLRRAADYIGAILGGTEMAA